MKKLSIIIVLLLCITICCACGDAGQDDTTATTLPVNAEVTYRVTVVDPLGAPVSGGVIVNFMNGTETAAMQITDAQGVAKATLSGGNYTVQLGFTDASAQYYYDQTNLSLTSDHTDLQIVLCKESDAEKKTYSTYDPDTGEETQHTEYLYYAEDGFTHIPLTADERTHVYFVPEKSGLYQFSVVEKGAKIGYYGSPYFIQSDNIAELDENGAFTVNVSNGMIGTGNTGTSVLVLGIDGGDLTDCIIRIQRISDPEKTIEDYPWEIYQATTEPGKFTLGEGVQVQNFDLTADSYTLILNEYDGFYHLNTADGPLVYAKLGVSSEYLDSIQKVLETSGVSRYFYDEEGNFVNKVSYTDCLLVYIACMDTESGLYPLTEDLAFIFQQRGEYVGWWDPEGSSYLFVDQNGNAVPGINTEIAWLFLCCYSVEPDVPDTPVTNEPTTPPTEPPTQPTQPQHTHSYTVETVAPGCTTEGYTVYKCGCGDSYTADRIAAAGHSWSAWATSKEPTLNDEGEEYRTCSTCGVSQSQTKPSLMGKPSSAEPVEVWYHEIVDSGLSFTASVKAGEYVNYQLYRLFDMVLTIESEDAYLIFGEEVIEPVNGVLKFTLVYGSNDVSSPCKIAIGNKGQSDTNFTVKMEMIVGTQGSPENLALGSFTTQTRAGDAQGYYYTFTAESKGVLTVQFDSINIQADCQISLYNLNTYSYMNETNGKVSVNVNAGDVIQINVAVVDDNYEYPAATIVATATME